MARSLGRAGHRWRQLVARVKREETHCAWCLAPLAPEVPYPDPWSTSVDHIVPLIEGGAPLARWNVCAMHKVCNERKGRRSLAARPVALVPSRDW